MEHNYYSFFAASMVQSKLWFSERRFNGLFQMDLSTLYVRFVCFFPEENILQQHIHRKSIVYNEKIVFLPDKGRSIHVYLVNEDKMLNIPVKVYTEQKVPIISDCVIVNHELWIFPGNLDQPLLLFDLETLELEEIWTFNIWCKKNLPIKNNGFVFSKIVYKKDIWASVAHTNIVVRWNISDRTVQSYDTGVNSLFGIYKSQNGFWLNTLTDESLVLWNPDEHSIKLFPVDSKIKKTDVMFNQIIEAGQQVYVLPATSNDILCLNADKEYFQKAFEYPAEFKYIENLKYAKFFNYEIIDNEIWLFPVGGNGILIINTVDNNAKSISLSVHNDLLIDSEPYVTIRKKLLKSALELGIVYENEEDTFENFLELLRNNEFIFFDKKNVIELCGKKIYSTIKNLL